MFAWGKLAGSEVRAWSSQAISQAKNAESPASITVRFDARGQVRAAVRIA
jgi:hypothetical protein